MLFPDGKLIIFSKAPVPGKVKTRLISELGADGAARLHQDMLEQKLRLATDNQIASVALFCSPNKEHPNFQQLQSRFVLELNSQAGDDLGKRMANAMQQALANHKQAVIIGTDCPPLDHLYLIEAFRALDQGADAVIGPASDGGYVLLGLSHFSKKIFEDIDWGGEKVFSQTITKLRQLGLNYVELKTLWDVDRPGDLIRYREHLSSGS